MIVLCPLIVSMLSMMLVFVGPTTPTPTCCCGSACAPVLPNLQWCVCYGLQCLIEKIPASIVDTCLSPAAFVCLRFLLLLFIPLSLYPLPFLVAGSRVL
jgi:hypothetical protein